MYDFGTPNHRWRGNMCSKNCQVNNFLSLVCCVNSHYHNHVNLCMHCTFQCFSSHALRAVKKDNIVKNDLNIIHNVPFYSDYKYPSKCHFQFSLLSFSRNSIGRENHLLNRNPYLIWSHLAWFSRYSQLEIRFSIAINKIFKQGFRFTNWWRGT